MDLATSPKPGDVLFTTKSKSISGIRLWQRLNGLQRFEYTHTALVVTETSLVEAMPTEKSGIKEIQTWMNKVTERGATLQVLRSRNDKVDLVPFLDAVRYWVDEGYDYYNWLLGKPDSPGKSICSESTARILVRAGRFKRPEAHTNKPIYPGTLFELLCRDGWQAYSGYAEVFPWSELDALLHRLLELSPYLTQMHASEIIKQLKDFGEVNAKLEKQDGALHLLLGSAEIGFTPLDLGFEFANAAIKVQLQAGQPSHYTDQEFFELASIVHEQDVSNLLRLCILAKEEAFRCYLRFSRSVMNFLGTNYITPIENILADMRDGSVNAAEAEKRILGWYIRTATFVRVCFAGMEKMEIRKRLDPKVTASTVTGATAELLLEVNQSIVGVFDNYREAFEVLEEHLDRVSRSIPSELCPVVEEEIGAYAEKIFESIRKQNTS